MSENDSSRCPPTDESLDDVARAKAREMTDNPRLKAALAGLQQASASGKAFDDPPPSREPQPRAPVASERQEAAVLTVPVASRVPTPEVEKVKLQVPVDRSRVMATQMSLVKQREKQAVSMGGPSAPQTPQNTSSDVVPAGAVAVGAPKAPVAWAPGQKPPLKLLTQRLGAAPEEPPVVTSPEQLEAIRAGAEGVAARTLGGYTQRMKEGSDHPPPIADESSAAPWAAGPMADTTSPDEASARMVPPPPESPLSTPPGSVLPRSSARLWIGVVVVVAVVAVGLGLWMAGRTAPASTAIVPVSPSISARVAPVGPSGAAPSASAVASAAAPPTVEPPETPSAAATASAAASAVRRPRETPAPVATGAHTSAPTPVPPQSKTAPASADSPIF